MLCFTDEEDEFVINFLREYDGKAFLSVNEADLNLATEDEKKQAEQQTEENKELLDFIKDALDGAVAEVKLSNKLKSHAVCLSSTGGVVWRWRSI
jgi:molecular chaperone HtpG